MRQNPAFKRLLIVAQTENWTAADVAGKPDGQLARAMWPPNGQRPLGDFTRVASARQCLKVLYEERRIRALASRFLTALRSLPAVQGAEMQHRAGRVFDVRVELRE